MDNCLCDACFRHVDRRANVPSYKKRLSDSGHLEMGSAAGSALEKQFAGDSGVITESGGEAGSTAAVAVQQRSCGVKDCVEAARHSLRRKCIRKRVKKYQLSLEIPAGSSNVGLCEAHYNTVIQFSGCVLCKRRLGKNHMYNITTVCILLVFLIRLMLIMVQNLSAGHNSTGKGAVRDGHPSSAWHGHCSLQAVSLFCQPFDKATG